jgi:hypothetical protein
LPSTDEIATDTKWIVLILPHICRITSPIKFNQTDIFEKMKTFNHKNHLFIHPRHRESMM